MKLIDKDALLAEREKERWEYTIPNDMEATIKDGKIIVRKKESEDEKIRKVLIDYFKRYKEQEECGVKKFYGIATNNILAWLEKQMQDGKKWIYEDVYLKEREQLYQDGVDDVLENPHKYGLEKQGESKFESCIQEGDKLVTNEDGTHFNISQLERVAKKEPRFEDGDWIVQKGLGTYKIVEICESWYEVISYKYGIQYSIGFDKENDCHLWTIQNAKDGDVLQLGEVTAIFKEFIGNENCRCYCSVCKGEFEIPSQDDDDNSYGCFNTTPATKEQRDLLFQKMKEAGYKWDAEKKELKKIEQKSAWSEEDETALQDTLWCIGQARKQAKDENDMGTCWFAERWLKSLKPQNRWKPSDEQMQALDTIYKTHCADSSCRRVVFNLLNDLKKLKGE